MMVGDEITERSVVVRGGAMKVFSLLSADPNPIHWDIAAVRALGLGDRAVNQGGLNAGYVVNALLAWAGPTSLVREVRLRFVGSAYEGDTVIAGGEITALEPDSIALRVWLRNAEGTELIRGTAVVDRRSS